MEELKKKLRSKNTEERRQVVESLRGKPEPSSIELLLEAMKDESWRVRKSATDILQSQFEIDDYVHGVLSLLSIEDNAGARNSAIDLLVSLGKQAVPFLIVAFDTDNHDVRKFVIDVIGEISDKRSIPLLLNALKDEDENVKASAVEHLGKLKEPTVVDALIEILRGDDIWIAYPAADALGMIGDERAIPELVEALEKKPLREPVLRSLAVFADPGSLDHIIPLLLNGTKSVKDEVLRTLSKFYAKGVPEDIIAEKVKKYLGEEAFEFLMKFAWSNKADVRISAILMLGILKDSRAVQPLLEMSSEEEFRDEIRKALIFIGRANPQFILDLFENPSILQRRFLLEVAGGIGDRAFRDLFVRLLGDEDGHVRALTAKGLAQLGAMDAVQDIMNLIADPFPDVQEAAVEALTALRDGIDREKLLEGLSSKISNVRKNSSLILGKMGVPGDSDAIGFVMKDPDVQVRKAAVTALSQLGGPLSTKYLMIALTDEVPDVRVSSAYALGRSREDESVQSLILLLSDPDESVRVAAAKAIGIHADERAVDALVNALSDSNGFVVTAALETLGKIRSERSRDAILGTLKSEDDEIKRTAISALTGFQGVIDRIVPFLRDRDWATRKVAVEVIGGQDDPKGRAIIEEMYDLEDDRTVKRTIEEILGV